MATVKLKEYRDKRDVSRTNEPLGEEPTRAGATTSGAFVVHQHHATRMHYDLRLEVGGVLASFAVPHGPSLDPAAKHLAVHTEDHPIEYLDFEDVVPEGTYGAGPMIVWDMGRVRYLDGTAEDGLRVGKLDFVLEGRKLRGRFALVRIKPSDPKRSKETSREWLLLKKKDAHASAERDIVADSPRSVLSGLTVDELAHRHTLAQALEEEAAELGAPATPLDGRTLSPMLCSLSPTSGERAVLPRGDWIHELKLDGVRLVAHKEGDGVALRYRTGRDATASYPEVARALRGLSPERLVLDGELVAFDDAGKPSFSRLARRIHARPRDAALLALELPVVLVVFDVLSIGQRSLLEVPLRDRKRLLGRLLPGPGILRALDHLEGDGEPLLRFCRAEHLEGVVSKRAGGAYRPGPDRTGDWVKTKLDREASFVVVGYTRGERGRRVSALDIASYRGSELVLRGKVGSGLDEASVDRLLELLGPLEIDTIAATGKLAPAPRGRVFVHPAVVVRVRFLELTAEGTVRHPVFLGIEPEVEPKRCTLASETDEGAPPEPGEGFEPEEGSGPDGDATAAPSTAVAFTNRGKLFWPTEGYTKGDLIDYYDAVADTLLPYLADRPVMLVRYPDGIDGKSFYQWNVPHGMPAWVKSVPLGRHTHAASDGDPADAKKHVFLVDRREALLYLANLACIPIHILASRVSAPDECDFLTIDFDVGRSSLATAVVLAHTLRGILDEAGLASFPKTSGQSGLHVFVPLFGAAVPPRAARTLADLLGRLVVERHPDVATMERVVAKRGARVYVDTGQTGPSRTIVAPYSVRAVDGARVSTPLSWTEVDEGLDPASFTIRTVPTRVARVGDPMRGLLDARADLPRAMTALGRLVGT